MTGNAASWSGDNKNAYLRDCSGDAGRTPDKFQESAPLFLAAALAASYGVLFVFALFFQRPVYIVQFISFGLDYHDFYQATEDVISGVNPYERSRFVTPPLSALLNMPLSFMPEGAAARLFFIVNASAVFGSVYILSNAYGLSSAQRTPFYLITLLSAPALMLIERGNIDGIVLLLLSLSILALERETISGALLGVAVALKAYPAILFAPLLLSKRWRLAGAALAVTVLPLILRWDLAQSFIGNQLIRGAACRLDENLSVFGIFCALSRFVPAIAPFQGALYGIAILAVLAIGVACDRKTEASHALTGDARQVRLISYLVFAVNVPTLVYLYSGVTVILTLMHTLHKPAALGAVSLRLLVWGSFLVFFPARAFDLTLSGVPFAYAINLLPPVGSGLLLAYFIALRIEANRLSPPAVASCQTRDETASRPPLLQIAGAEAFAIVPVMPVPVVVMPVPPVMISPGGLSLARACGGRHSPRASLLSGGSRLQLVLQRILRPWRELQLRPGELQFEALGKVALAGIGLCAPQLDLRLPAAGSAAHREVRLRRAPAGLDGHRNAARPGLAGNNPFKLLLRRRKSCGSKHQSGRKSDWLQICTHHSCPKLKAAPFLEGSAPPEPLES